jgi:hypothetical protein
MSSSFLGGRHQHADKRYANNQGQGDKNIQRAEKGLAGGDNADLIRKKMFFSGHQQRR